MNPTPFDDTHDRGVQVPGRRRSVQSLLAAGLALLATVGLEPPGEAKKQRHRGNRQEPRDRPQAEKKKGGQAGTDWSHGADRSCGRRYGRWRDGTDWTYRSPREHRHIWLPGAAGAHGSHWCADVRHLCHGR